MMGLGSRATFSVSMAFEGRCFQEFPKVNRTCSHARTSACDYFTGRSNTQVSYDDSLYLPQKIISGFLCRERHRKKYSTFS